MRTNDRITLTHAVSLSLYLVAAAIFVSTLAPPDRAQAQEVRRQVAPKAILELGGNRVEAPFKIVARHILVDVFINDQGPFPFVFDTGAGLTAIDKKLADRLGLKEAGQARVGDATTSGAQTASIYKLDQIRLGSAKWSSGSCVGLDLGELYEGEPDHPLGIVGISLFADCLVTVDYPKNRIVMETGELPEPDGKSVLACDYKMGLPSIKCELAGKSLELTFDTGAALSMALAESQKGDVPLKGELKTVGISKRLNTEEKVNEARAAGDLTLGTFHVRNPRLTYAGVRSIMGYDVLKNFALTFDRKNQRVRLQAADQPLDVVPRVTAGFGTKFVDGGRKVRYVLPGLAADQAGVKVDDEITALDGKPCKDWTRGALRERLETPGKLRLDLKRGDQTIKATLEVAIIVP